jgi:hypothetical protein
MADSLSGDPLLASLFKIALDAQDAAPRNQTGMHALAGVNFDLPSIAVNRDQLRAAHGGVLLSLTRFFHQGKHGPRPDIRSCGPVLSASFDISYLAQSDMDRLVDRAVKVMMRPTITSLTPRDGAIDLSWRLPSSGACAEIRVIGPSGAVSTLRAAAQALHLPGLTMTHHIAFPCAPYTQTAPYQNGAETRPLRRQRPEVLRCRRLTA